MANEEQLLANERNDTTLKARHLNTGLPKPNIVRIEVLDGNARLKYLGTLQRFSDTQFRSKLYDNLVKREDSIFFGFIKHGSKQDMSFSTRWEDLDGSGGLLGGIKNTLGVGGLVEGIENAGQALTGISATATGSSSLKKYSRSTLEDFNVECVWYLPEQLSLCTRSLQILAKMAYPRQVPEGGLQQNLPAILNYVSGLAADAVEGDGSLADWLKSSGANILKFASETSPTVLENFDTLNRLFGRNLTFDPLPVRVSVGQYVDIEPLVINKVNIDFSKETFVHNSGRHLPITCSVNISFEFWLRPAPNKQFASLLGRELFGETDSEKFQKDAKALSEVDIRNALEEIRRQGGTISLEDIGRRAEEARRNRRRFNVRATGEILPDNFGRNTNS